MSKINNLPAQTGIKITYRVVYSLGILAILAFGVIIMPTNASAQSYVTPYGSTNWNNYNYDNNNYPYYNYYPPTQMNPVPVEESPTIYSNTKTVNKTTTVAVAKKAPAKTSTDKMLDDSSNLAANAVFGSNSFMPSGIIQWILFAILILISVILVRKIFGARENYHATPMKHD